MPGPHTKFLTVPLGIIARFGLGGWDVSYGLEEPSVIEPVDPFEGGELDGLEVAPGSAPMDDLGLVEAVDRLGERVVVGIADAADRGHEAGLRQPLSVFDRHVLHAPIAVMNQTAASNRSTIVQRLLQRVEDEAGMGRARRSPADDPPREGVDDKGDIDEALPGRDVGEVGNPQRVRPRRLELAVDLVERTRGRAVADRRPHEFAANRSL